MNEPPLEVRRSGQFKKDAKRFRHQTSLLAAIDEVIRTLANREPLDARHKDHQLIGGDYHGFRDCHVRPDLVLIYAILENPPALYLFRLGTHSELGL